MIRGYAEQPSPREGEPMTLRVATDAARFRVETYRCGDGMTPYGMTSWLSGVDAPEGPPYRDWRWPAYPMTAPRKAGVYVAVLVEEEEETDRGTLDGRWGGALFVVRPARAAAPILYKIPLLTYHAYNPAGGAPDGVAVHRPGGGTGGVPYDVFNIDPFDPTPRQTYAHWDGRFVGWLARAGYPVDFCTDVDLHREGAALLAPHRLPVSAGHDEYWSEEMRDAVEGHVAAGGHVAFFGGNTCWWRVVFRDGTTFSRAGLRHEIGRPENTLTGVSFRNGGERDRDEHPVRVGFRVQHTGHWV